MTTISRWRLAAIFLCNLQMFGQDPTQETLDLQQAVQRAARFPSVIAAQEQVNAAVAEIRLARTNYLPGLNAIGQVNRATRNNVFGLLLPQSAIPNMSGPVLGTNNGSTVWGSAAGILVSWEPFDFGRRNAMVASAEATRQRTQLTADRTQYDTQTATAAAFLTLLATQQTNRAAQAAVERAQVLVRTVKSLVDAKLRPGADLSRADAELDAAETQLLQAEQSVSVAKASLAEFTGSDAGRLTIVEGHFLAAMPDAAAAPSDFANNPVAKEQAATVGEYKSKLAVLQHSYRPTFELQAAAYGRGTGALVNGVTLGGTNGLAPNYFNVATGFTVNFPVFSLFSLHAEEAQNEALQRAAQATYRKVIADLKAQSSAGQATLEQARRIAAETPKEVADAETGFAQANAQYKAGLATIVAVAEAQRLLAQAQIDDSLAKLAVWRAWLEIQIASGDISSFVKEASR